VCVCTYWLILASMLMSMSDLSDIVCCLLTTASVCTPGDGPLEYVATAAAAGDDGGDDSKKAFLARSRMKS